MKCPCCNGELDNVIVGVSNLGTGKIDDDGRMLVEQNEEGLDWLCCGNCNNDLPLALVSSWDWKEE